MKSSKIYSILQSFDKNDWKHCHKYIHYKLNDNSRECILFDYIFKHRNSFESSKMTQEYIYEKHFSHTVFKSFQNVIYRLHDLLETFLIVDEIEQNNQWQQKKRLLLSAHQRRGIYDLYSTEIDRTISQLEKRKEHGLFSTFELMEMLHTDYFSDRHYNTHKNPKSLYSAISNLETFRTDLKAFYLLEIENTKYLYPQAIKSNEYINLKSPIDNVLKHLHDLIQHKSDASFKILSNLILKKEMILKGVLAEATLIYLINHCYYKIKNKDKSMIQKVAELQLFGLNEGILLKSGKLTESRFLNIVSALSKASIKLVDKKFINKWAIKVETPNKEMIQTFALAIWDSSNGKYESALELLSKVDFSRTQLMLALRLQQLKLCCICSVYPEYLYKEEILKSNKAFYNRNKSKISSPSYIGSINLIKIVEMIWNKTSIFEIKRELNTFEYIVNRYWIDKELESYDPSNKRKAIT